MKKHHGFTLLEMAIVLVIVTLLAAAGLSLTNALRTNQGISTTRTKQEAIKVALITFIARNQRLPCPAIESIDPSVTLVGYGVESVGPGDCGAATDIAGGAVQRGVVPWVSLGLSDADALDAWNNRFSYFVVQTETAIPADVAPLSGMRGSITLHSTTPVLFGNQINACTTPGNGCNIAAVVLILSYGNNGSGAFMPSGERRLPLPPAVAREFENTDPDNASFVQTQYSDDPVDPFDDILLAITPADLLGPLERNNSIQSALAVTNDQINRLRDTINASIVNSASGTAPGGAVVPLTLSPPVTPLPDGWGTDLTYTRDPLITNVCGDPPASTAFRITSNNVDLVPGGLNDDIVYAQSNDQLRIMIFSQGKPCFP